MNNNNWQVRLKSLFAAIFRKPLVLIVLALVIIAVMMATRSKPETVPPIERVWPVTVVIATRQAEQPLLQLYGEVVAGRRSEMRALVPGSIVSVGPNFSEGARVSKGDLLVQIDPFEYENNLAEQRALLAEAETRMKTVERDLTRIRKLYDENNVSEKDLDDATLAVDQQVAIFAQRRIGLSRAQRALKETRLTAPYAGVVHGVSADLGKQLGVNDKIAEVIDTNRLDVRYNLSNAQFGRLFEGGAPFEGRQVQIAWQVGNEKLEFKATVERVGAEIDATTGGVELYAAIEAGQDTPLRPGAFVWVYMPDKQYDSVFRVPDSALYGENTVYVVKNDRLEARTIEVVGYAGDDLLFQSSAEPQLEDGDKVVVTQIREGGAGIRVEVR